MVRARRIVRRHYARSYHPLHRALARVLVTIAWPPAVLLHLWEIRRSRGPRAVPIKEASRAFWAAIRNNVIPGEYYAYALWRSDRPVFSIGEILAFLDLRPDVFALNARHAGVNWYRHHLGELRTVRAGETRHPEAVA